MTPDLPPNLLSSRFDTIEDKIKRAVEAVIRLDGWSTPRIRALEKQILVMWEKIEGLENLQHRFEYDLMPLIKTGSEIKRFVDEDKANRNALSQDQQIIVKLLEENPGGMSNGALYKLWRETTSMSAATYHIALYGSTGYISNPPPDSLFNKEPHLKTELRNKSKAHHPHIKTGAKIRWFWLEPKRLKPIKYPAVKLE